MKQIKARQVEERVAVGFLSPDGMDVTGLLPRNGQPVLTGYGDLLYTGGTPIAGKPGWSPKDLVHIWQFGGDPTNPVEEADWLEEADTYCRAREGKVLWLGHNFRLGRAVSLQARKIWGTGRIILNSGFAPHADGWAVRIGENSTSRDGRVHYEMFADGAEFFGIPTGDWDPASGLFPLTSGDITNFSYRAISAGTVAGVSFGVNDIIIAQRSRPSRTVYTGHWLKQPMQTMFRVEGLALPESRLILGAKNVSRGVHLFGNTERIFGDFSSRYVHQAVFEEDGGTPGDDEPDNNRILIRSGNFGQLYENSGTVVSHVDFDAQVQLADYRRSAVVIGAARTTSLGGCIRAVNHRSVLVDQNGGADSTGVIFRDLLCIGSSTMQDATWLQVNDAGFLQGRIIGQQMRTGAFIKGCEGADLVIVSDQQKDGYGLRVGDGAQKPTRSRIGFMANRELLDYSLLVVDAQDTLFELMGTPGDVLCTTHTRSFVRVPAAFLEAGKSIQRDKIDIEWVGSIKDTKTQGSASGKSTAVVIHALVGKITTNNATLAAGARASFKVTNNYVQPTDKVTVWVLNGQNRYNVYVGDVGDQDFDIVIVNDSLSDQSDAIEIGFEVEPRNFA